MRRIIRLREALIIKTVRNTILRTFAVVSRPLSLFVLGGGTVFAMFAVILWCFDLHPVFSGSVPPGLYHVIQKPIAKGVYVAVCVPEPFASFGLGRGYLESGSCPGHTRPVLKTVMAMEGETVEITDLMQTDALGRPIPHLLFGWRILLPGEIWLQSDYHPRSWDSRYWGPIKQKDVLFAAEAWWTF